MNSRPAVLFGLNRVFAGAVGMLMSFAGLVDSAIAQPVRTVHGQVEDSSGLPIAKAEVSFRPTANHVGESMFTGWQTKKVETDSTGRFEARLKRPGWTHVDVEIRAAGFLRGQLRGVALEPATEVAAKSDLGTVVLRPGGDVKGRVSKPDGTPIAGAEVRITDRGSRLPAVRTASDGSFAVRSLGSSGPLRVTIKREGYQRSDFALDALPDKLLTWVLEPGFKIVGKARDSQGKPVKGATVWCLDRASQLLPTSTDDSGGFEFHGLPSRPHRLWAETEKQESKIAEIALPQNSSNELVLTLRPLPLLRGRVLGIDGKPVRGAAVKLSHYRDSICCSLSVETTDADGRFQLLARAEHYEIEVAHPDFRAFEQEFALTEADTVLELQFRERQNTTLSGRVIGIDGAPLAGARLELFGQEGLPMPRDEYQEAVSKARGEFEIKAPRPGSYLVVVSGENDLPAGHSTVLELGDEGLEGVVVRLRHPVRLSGRVLGLSAEQLAELELRVLQPGTLGAIGRVSADGQYSFEQLAPGSWKIAARLAEDLHTFPLEIESEKPNRYDLDFSSLHLIKGTVVVDGNPLGEAMVVADCGGYQQVGNLGAGGTFELLAPAGECEISALNGALAGSLARRVDVGGPQEVSLVARTFRISGTVVDSETKLAKAGVQVLLLSETAGRRETFSDASGHFEIGRVMSGEWQLAAVLRGREVGLRPIPIFQSDVEGVEIEIPPAP